MKGSASSRWLTESQTSLGCWTRTALAERGQRQVRPEVDHVPAQLAERQLAAEPGRVYRSPSGAAAERQRRLRQRAAAAGGSGPSGPTRRSGRRGAPGRRPAIAPPTRGRVAPSPAGSGRRPGRRAPNPDARRPVGSNPVPPAARPRFKASASASQRRHAVLVGRRRPRPLDLQEADQPDAPAGSARGRTASPRRAGPGDARRPSGSPAARRRSTQRLIVLRLTPRCSASSLVFRSFSSTA